MAGDIEVKLSSLFQDRKNDIIPGNTVVNTTIKCCFSAVGGVEHYPEITQHSSFVVSFLI